MFTKLVNRSDDYITELGSHMTVAMVAPLMRSAVGLNVSFSLVLTHKEKKPKFIADICHRRHHRWWCTSLCPFFHRKAKCWPIFAFFAYFCLFCLFCYEFMHFLVFFYRAKQCGGVGKLTNIMYAQVTFFWLEAF